MLGRSSLGFVRNLSQYVPKHDMPCKTDKENFTKFITEYNHILVLTGAGVSTESGIPDYRSEGVGLFSGKGHKPIQHSEFIKSQEARTRYWARNFVGWPKFSTLTPNKTHLALASLQLIPNKIDGIITQNVDGLHQRAGSANVIDLHGNSYWVQCLECHALTHRNDFQHTLEKLNNFIKTDAQELRPDGDVDIDDEFYKKFVVPDCEKCGGILKPCVVFFGDNVPQKRVKLVENLVEKCDAMLVMGTSLSTLSSLRIVQQASDLCKLVVIVNIGKTRGNKYADLVINTNCSLIFPVNEDICDPLYYDLSFIKKK